MGGKGGLMKECILYRCGVSSEQRLHSESSSGAREWCYSDSAQRCVYGVAPTTLHLDGTCVCMQIKGGSGY